VVAVVVIVVVVVVAYTLHYSSRPRLRKLLCRVSGS